MNSVRIGGSVGAIALQEFMSRNWDYFGYGELEDSEEKTLTSLS